MKYIYLDEFCWISLRTSAYSNQTRDSSESILDLCRMKSKAGEWVLPLSMWHLIETQNTGDDKKRVDLGKIQAELSKGWMLTTYPNIKKYEVKGYLLDKPFFSARNKIISRETSIPEDEIAQLIDGVTQENVKQAKQIYDKLGLNYLVFIQQVKQYIPFLKDKQEQLEYIRLLSKHRKTSGYSFAEFCMENFKKYFSLEDQSAILKKIFEIVSDLPQKKAREQLLDEFEKLPSFYTAMKLLWELISQKPEEKLKKNDFTDIVFLSSAIPYCDVIVTEKQWVSYAKKQKLDSKYQTTLYSDMHSLFEIK